MKHNEIKYSEKEQARIESLWENPKINKAAKAIMFYKPKDEKLAYFRIVAKNNILDIVCRLSLNKKLTKPLQKYLDAHSASLGPLGGLFTNLKTQLEQATGKKL